MSPRKLFQLCSEALFLFLLFWPSRSLFHYMRDTLQAPYWVVACVSILFFGLVILVYGLRLALSYNTGRDDEYARLYSEFSVVQRPRPDLKDVEDLGEDA